MMSIRSRACVLLILAALSQGHVHADGGFIEMQKQVGALLITVFASPAPLSVGVSDISVLVQQRDASRPLLDAEVAILLRRRGSTTEIRAHATRAQAQNKLLYAALVTIPEPGEWRLFVTTLHNGTYTEISRDVAVTETGPMASGGWEFIALPVLAITLFMIRECLLRRRPSLRVSTCETI